MEVSSTFLLKWRIISFLATLSLTSMAPFLLLAPGILLKLFQWSGNRRQCGS
uniref:Fructose-2 6-bisphosphatase n=1 Tax=Rhizophora mucronata TaxID=61149 RepID=A0A2P2MUV3_RHIMU